MHERCKEIDMMDLCYFVGLVGVESNNCVDWWDGTFTNIFKSWDTIPLGHAYAWQQSISKSFSEAKYTGSLRLKVLVYNSSSDSLRAAVKAKYSKLQPNCQGGFTRLYITLCEMFKMTREM